MAFKYLAPGLLLVAVTLTACNSSEKDLQPGIELTSYLAEDITLTGYVQSENVEILYGFESLRFRADGEQWASMSLPMTDIYSAVIFSPEHWLLSVAGSNTYDESGEFTPLFETTDAGANWQYQQVHAELPDPEVVSGLAYDFAQDILYADIGGELARSTNRGASFEILTSESGLPVRSKRLVLNPSRPELWWIGMLDLVSGGGTPADAAVRKYELSVSDGVTDVHDKTDDIDLDRVSGGLVSSNNPNTIYIAGDSGIAASHDGGTSWDLIYSGYSFVNLVQSESGDKLMTVFKESEDVYLACSSDEGASWTENLVMGYPAERTVSMLERSGESLIIGFTSAGAYSLQISELSCDM